MKTREQIAEGKYKNYVRTHDGSYVDEEELSMLFASLAPNLWSGYSQQMAMIRLGAFVARASDDEINTRLNVAKVQNLKCDLGFA